MEIETPRILLIYTGGTIGMMKDPKSGALKSFNFDKLLKYIPEIKLIACQIETVSFEHPVDSSDMNPVLWKQIGDIIYKEYTNFEGFVVLHGSDTMSYTASALSFMFENLAKPIICTGSQLPIGDLRTDAKENVITAIQLAALQKNNLPVLQEVGLYFEYKLLRGNRTSKMNAVHFEAFKSYNYPPLAISGVNLTVNYNYVYQLKNDDPLTYQSTFNTDIVVLPLYPGISEKITTKILINSEIKGVIFETFGTGNTMTMDWFHKSTERFAKKKHSRCKLYTMQNGQGRNDNLRNG